MNLKDKRVVCVITGTGLKDPELATRLDPVYIGEHPAELSAVEQALTLA